ncbi:MAG: HDOD domain-containing protein [Campylobacterales bacterium]
MNTSIATAIKSLPPLSESVIEIQRLCTNPDSSLQDISRIVEKDPMLTANILKAANSPLYGFSREVTSVAQAVSLFGMATILGFAVSSAIKNAVKVDMSCYGTNEEKFAQVSILQSALMSNWASKIDRHKLQVLAPASFLNETGKIVIAIVLKSTNKVKEFAEAIKSRPIEEVEVELAGATSAQAAADLFTLWKFDQRIVNTIRYSTHPLEADSETAPCAALLYVVKKAINLDATITEESKAAAIQAAQELKLDTTILADEIDKLAKRL